MNHSTFPQRLFRMWRLLPGPIFALILILASATLVLPATAQEAPAVTQPDRTGDAAPASDDEQPNSTDHGTPASDDASQPADAEQHDNDDASKPATTEQHAEGVDWGPNSNGWNITLINATPYTLTYPPDRRVLIPLFTDNVYYGPPSIAPGATETGIRGRESLFSGPANMRIEYSINNPTDKDLWGVLINVSASFSGDVSASTDINGVCSDMPCTPRYRASVVTAVANQPVVVKLVP
ncbi:MAG: hypothetical protein JO352_04120 [Chloroflexi bacterium]|nr:hypothetical protein [Chloroflexota bacterium]MBV9596782.1 hypothetical protein [Chloroflexota bacterium]